MRKKDKIVDLLNKPFELPNISGEFKITRQFNCYFLEKCGHFYGTIHQFSESELTARDMYFNKLVEHHIPFSQIQVK